MRKVLPVLCALSIILATLIAFNSSNRVENSSSSLNKGGTILKSTRAVTSERLAQTPPLKSGTNYTFPASENQLGGEVDNRNQGSVEAISICVIDFMRENGIELLARDTVIEDTGFFLLRYDFDQNIRFYIYLSKVFKQGLLDSLARPLVIDQIYSSSIPASLLGWGGESYNLTTAISSDKINSLPPGLVERVNSRITLCMALNSPDNLKSDTNKIN